MALHRLTSLTMGVPDVTGTAAYYAEFGLAPDADGWFTTQDAGRQLRIVHAPTRRLVEVRIGVDTPDDLAAAASRLDRLGIDSTSGAGTLTAYDRATAVRAVLGHSPPDPGPGYGTADDAAELSGLVRQLREQLREPLTTSASPR